jgi:uncharacterized Rmd1/YagE family protein
MLVRAANLWGFQEALDHIWPQCRHAFFDDTLHVVQRSNSEHSDKGDVFLLSLGTVVFWGLTESEEQLCVKRLRGMVERHEWGSDLVLDKDVQSDTLYFGYLDIGKEVTLSKDVIMLPRYQFSKLDVRAKLAVSMAMAQARPSHARVVCGAHGMVYYSCIEHVVCCSR